MKQAKRDWTLVDAAILGALWRARLPLHSEDIFARADVPRLHFDLRLQSLKRRGLIEIVDGRTSGARWRAVRLG